MIIAGVEGESCLFSMLIVDDNRNDRMGITGLIKWDELDITVAGTAVNGLDGYEKAIQLHPDFILTDIAMPHMNGIEMTQKILEQLPETRFIYMSCYDDFKYMQSAIDMQVSAYILKPIKLHELSAAIMKVKAMRTAYLNMQHNERMVKKMLEESLPFLQEQFLKELIYKRFEDESSILGRAEYLKLNFSCRFYTVLSIQIDNYNLLFSNTPIGEKHTLIYGLKKLVEQTILNGIAGYALSDHLNAVTAIVFFREESEPEALEKLSEACNNCIEQANNVLNIGITIGISPFEQKLSAITEAYDHSEEAVQSKFYGTGNRMIFYSEVDESNPSVKYNLQTLKKEIDDYIEYGEGDSTEIITKYLKVSDEKNERASRSFAYAVMNILQTVLLENNLSFSTLFEDEFSLWKKLSLYETIIDIRQLLIHTLNAVKGILGKEDLSRNVSIADSIKKVIDERYADIKNINQVVKDIHICASHANAIFKQQTGQTIFDYLTWKRIEAAKKLLRDPYIKIYEIPEKIGYKTDAHFRLVFKQTTGKTPKQYQEM